MCAGRQPHDLFGKPPVRRVGMGGTTTGHRGREASTPPRQSGRLVNPLARDPPSSLIVKALDSASKGHGFETRLGHTRSPNGATWRSYSDPAKEERVRRDGACGLAAGRREPRQKRAPADPTGTDTLGAAVRVLGAECRIGSVGIDRGPRKSPGSYLDRPCGNW